FPRVTQQADEDVFRPDRRGPELGDRVPREEQRPPCRFRVAVEHDPGRYNRTGALRSQGTRPRSRRCSFWWPRWAAGWRITSWGGGCATMAFLFGPAAVVRDGVDQLGESAHAKFGDDRVDVVRRISEPQRARMRQPQRERGAVRREQRIVIFRVRPPVRPHL